MNDIIKTLHTIDQAIHEAFRTRAPLRVSPWMVCRALSDNPGVSQTTLVDLSGVDRSTLSDIVRRLIDGGLIDRRDNKYDSRAWTLVLTKKGETLTRESTAIAEEVTSALLASVSKQHAAGLIAGLSSMASVDLKAREAA